MPERFVIGVDGGGSKTTVVVANQQGKPLGKIQGGATNYHSVGGEAAFQALNQAIGEALGIAGIGREKIAAIGMGMSGVDRPSDRELFYSWAGKQFPQARLALVNDALILIAAGTENNWGIGVIAGTGSIVIGRNPYGAVKRAGGWGYLLGDEGSGYQVGLHAMQAVAKAFDGRNAPTSLTKRVLEMLSLASPANLVDYIYQATTSRGDIARLAGLVDEEAAAGDKMALEIIRQGATELALCAQSVAGRLGFSGSIPCAIGGGFILHSLQMYRAFELAANSIQLNFEPIRKVVDPVDGAIRLAIDLLTSGEK